jgi:hypothetical protein
MNDTPTLVRFLESYAEDGVDEGGMPVYRESIGIILSRPPLLQIEREATEQDFDDYPVQFQMFNKQHAARKAVETAKADGYPLMIWTAISPSELKMCLDRDITTVQELSKFAKSTGSGVPAQIVEVAKRAQKMVELQSKIGKHAEVITELTNERDALMEQLKEANATISAQNTLINTLKLRVA